MRTVLLILFSAAIVWTGGEITAGKMAYGQVRTYGTPSLRSKKVGVPRSPSSPDEPASPSVPGEPNKSGLSPSDCRLALWGCEQECQRTYLSSATSPSLGAPQRARVELDYCRAACSKVLSCESPLNQNTAD